MTQNDSIGKNAPVHHARRGWSVEGFTAFWSKPDVRHVAQALTADVTCYWPRSLVPVQGREAYTRRIADLLQLVPDLHLEVAEHASNGEFTFVRWIAHGTLPLGSGEFSGVDRIRLRDGLVAENRIFSDHPVFELLAGSRRTGD